jgi:CRISPR-associated endonuclease/helicase Cas3
LLLGGDPYASQWEDRLYAKSAKVPSSLQERAAIRALSRLPDNFRHEVLSLVFAECNLERFSDVEHSELMLHLIASHHGHARPWVPVCLDNDPPDVSLERIGLSDIALTAERRRSIVHHRVDSTVPLRFWSVTQTYGWWGIALLESVLRLADHRVSQIEATMQLGNRIERIGELV